MSHDAAPAATDPTATSISVSDPSVIGTGGFTFNATAGVAPPSQTVATFTDPGGAEGISHYGASINWGDSTTASAGTITFNSATQVFTVSATHAYSAIGSYRIAVTLSHDSSASVQVTSSATVVAAPKTIGLLLLDPTGNGALTDSGNGHINVNNGAILVVDSNNPSYAANVSGYGIVTATEVDVVGGLSVGSTAHVNGTVGHTSAADPFASLPTPGVPTPTRSTSTLVVSGNPSVTLHPGLYNGGISILGNAKVTLAAGLYYLKGGGFVVSGNGIVTGTGVLLYNASQTTSDSLKLNTNAQVTLSAATTGTYAGLAFFQDRTATAQIVMTDNAILNVTGGVYAAKAAFVSSTNGSIVLHGDGSTNGIGRLVAYDMNLSGNATVTANGGNPLMAAGVARPPAPPAALTYPVLTSAE